MIITLLLQFIPKFKNKIKTNKFSNVLIGIVIIQSAYIMLLFKIPLDFYLMPALMFSVFGLYAVNSILSDLFPQIFVKSKYLYLNSSISSFCCFHYCLKYAWMRMSIKKPDKFVFVSHFPIIGWICVQSPFLQPFFLHKWEYSHQSNHRQSALRWCVR